MASLVHGISIPRNLGITRRSSGRLRVGFVPLCDSAPVVVALERGLFRKQGLEVELSREIGWATIREKLVHGQLAEEKAGQHLRLVAAVAEACDHCAEPANHDDLARLLARPQYVNAPADLIRRSFSGEFQTHQRGDAHPERFTIYAGDDVNVPTPEIGQPAHLAGL